MHTPPLTLDKGKIRLALGDPETPGMVLLTIAMYTLGDAVLGDPAAGIEAMDPSELWADLNEAYGVWVTEEGENKLNALTLALQGDLFYRDVEVFQAVCQALLDGDLGDLLSSEFEDLTAVDVMWTILEVDLARDDDNGPPEFSSGVSELINRVLMVEQDDQEENSAAVKEEYYHMLRQLKDLGIPTSALRLLDEEFAETLEALETRTQV